MFTRYLVDDSLVVLGGEHEVDDRADHPSLGAGVSPREKGVEVVLLLQDVVHLAVPRHQADAHDAPLLHVCIKSNKAQGEVASLTF